MTTEKILQYLKDEKIEELKGLLLQELSLEEVKASSAKNNFKKVYNYIYKDKNISKTYKGYSTYEDYQVITDSYFLAVLKDEDINPLFTEQLEESKQVQLRRIIPRFNCFISISSEFKMTGEEFLKMVKLASLNSNEKHIYLNKLNRYFIKKYLDIAITALNIKKNDILKITVHSEEFKPIRVFKESTGSFINICPFRVKG